MFWDVLKEVIGVIFQELQEDRICTNPLDYSYVCLIPKMKGPRKTSDFRPMSLFNGIHKTISKVLANRLATVLQSLISQS